MAYFYEDNEAGVTIAFEDGVKTPLQDDIAALLGDVHIRDKPVNKIWGCTSTDYDRIGIGWNKRSRSNSYEQLPDQPPFRRLQAWLFDQYRIDIDGLHRGPKNSRDPILSRALAGPIRLSTYVDKLSKFHGSVPDGFEGVSPLVDIVNRKMQLWVGEGKVNDDELFGTSPAAIRQFLGPRSRHPRDGINVPANEPDMHEFENTRSQIVRFGQASIKKSGDELRQTAFPHLAREGGLFRILVVDDFHPLLYPWFDQLAALEPWEFSFLSGLPPRQADELKTLPGERVDLRRLQEDLGLDVADPQPWHLILLDIDFGWQGYGDVASDYLVALKKLLPGTPVIMISRWDYLDGVVPYIKNGAADYISKDAKAYVAKEGEQPASVNGYETEVWIPEYWREFIKKTLCKRWGVKERRVARLQTTPVTGESMPSGRVIIIDDTERASIGYLPNWHPPVSVGSPEWCGLGAGPFREGQIETRDYFGEALRDKSDEAFADGRTVTENLGRELEKKGLPKADAAYVALAALPLTRTSEPERYLLVPMDDMTNVGGRIAVFIRTPAHTNEETYYASKLVDRLQAGAARADRSGGSRTEQLIMSLWKDLHYMVVSDFSLLSLFDILGPDMTGPSSSHTAGACRIGRLVRNWLAALRTGRVDIDGKTLEVVMHGSFRTTGEGHGSDAAVLGGLLGRLPSDPQLKSSRSSFRGFPEHKPRDNADDEGVWPQDDHGFPERVKLVWDEPGEPGLHANTIRFRLTDGQDIYEWLTGRSWGGGNVQISGIGKGDTRGPITEPSLDKDKKRFAGRRPIYVYPDWDISEDRRTDPPPTYTIEATVDAAGPGDDPALVTTFGSLAGSIAERRDGEIPIKVDDPISLTFSKGPGDPKIIVTVLNFAWGNTRVQSREQTGGEDIPVWERALRYESWVSGRKDYEAIRRSPQNVQGNGKEQPLTVRKALEVMLDSVIAGLRDESGDAWRSFDQLSGLGPAGCAYAYSLAVQRQNADYGRILAAPTAGACGIVPGALFAVAFKPEDIRLWIRENTPAANIIEGISDLDKTKLEDSLLAAAIVGLIINNIVPTAGAVYGCQAEIGVGAGMAAAAVCQYLEGKPTSIIHATALALKNTIGLTCDPVAGRVETPCIKRSASKAVEALVVGHAASCGLLSAIGPDEVIWVLKEAGEAMPDKFKETSLGGLAQTISGRSGCPTCGGFACRPGTCLG